MTRRTLLAFCVVALLVGSGAAPLEAKSMRWAGRSDTQSMDPHAPNDSLGGNINALVYEALVGRDRRLAPVPALATSWEQVGPSTWRFRLRPGVRWADGSDFTADDVVFSFVRAGAGTSALRAFARAAGAVRRVDRLTVEFTTSGPNPAMLEHVAAIGVMSRAWCERNRATKPHDPAAGDDAVTARRAMGTGPYLLRSSEPNVKTVLVKNPGWWGIRETRFEGNVDEVVYTPVGSDAMRVAALVSGDVDLVSDPPPQDVPRLARTPGVKVLEGAENRVLFVGMDQGRDELLYSSVKGRNPLKDRRVREALYRAIDAAAIVRTTMRGLARPTGVVLPSPAQSTPELELRVPYDRGAARKLLAEAGYAGGFDITLDCPNDRHVDDEKLCQAIAAMWSRVGVNTRVAAMPRATLTARLGKRDTSIYMTVWDTVSTDAFFTLQPLIVTWNGSGDGEHNVGRFSDPGLDALAARIKVEMDREVRLALIRAALAAQKAGFHYIPLHRPVTPWATRAGVVIAHRADNWVMPVWVSMP